MSLEDEERREAYRRGSDLDIRALYVDAQRLSDMLVRHERELRDIREAAVQNRTLLLGAEGTGAGGILNEVEHLSKAIENMTSAFGDRVDNIRTWAVGAVIAFVTGSIGVIVTIVATAPHH